MQTNNPYANPDGSPVKGNAGQFWTWEWKKEEARLAALPPKERQRQQAIKKHMADK